MLMFSGCTEINLNCRSYHYPKNSLPLIFIKCVSVLVYYLLPLMPLNSNIKIS